MNNIEILEEFINKVDIYFNDDIGDCAITSKIAGIIKNLIQENKELKEKYKRLSIEAQATAFDDMNKDTEGLLRVLLKQGEITLDEKGYYQRKDFDWEENLTKMGLMKKREKNFYIPDDSLDEYIKQLENQLKEYNEMKEIFKKYYVIGNETMYDGCCKMQDEIDELKEENKELKEKNKKLENEYINPNKARFSYYDNTKGMEIVINGFTANSKLKEIIYPTPENPIPFEVQTSEMYKKLEKLVEGE